MNHIRIAAASAILLSSCAPMPSVQWAPGVSLAQAKTNSVPGNAAKSVRIESNVRLRTNGRTMHFDAVVVADSSRGRMEALGPFGVALATVVWHDSTWEVWLPSQGALVRGTGDSLSLPVVGLRTIRPRELVAPFLGNAFSAPAGTPMHSVGGDGKQIVLMPNGDDPHWAVTLDRTSGLPLRKQILRNGKESERLRFGAWKVRDGVTVPDSIVRTGRDSQEVVLHLTSWERLDALAPSVFDLMLEKPVDTIFVVRDGAGRTRYRVRPAAGGAEAIEDIADTLSTENDDASNSPDTDIDDGGDLPSE